MNPLLNADLHCHSTVSDGTLSPEALAERAKANGVELWSLTDHDEIGGQDRAIAAARQAGLPYLTGAEVSVTFANVTVHILGLGFDHANPALIEGLRHAGVIPDLRYIKLAFHFVSSNKFLIAK